MAKYRWGIDPEHSQITFKVKHLMIANLTGSFHKYDVQIETEEEDFIDSKVTFTADVDSISTKNEQRDTHLRSPDFFDVKNTLRLNSLPLNTKV